MLKNYVTPHRKKKEKRLVAKSVRTPIRNSRLVSFWRCAGKEAMRAACTGASLFGGAVSLCRSRPSFLDFVTCAYEPGTQSSAACTLPVSGVVTLHSRRRLASSGCGWTFNAPRLGRPPPLPGRMPWMSQCSPFNQGARDDGAAIVARVSPRVDMELLPRRAPYCSGECGPFRSGPEGGVEMVDSNECRTSCSCVSLIMLGWKELCSAQSLLSFVSC